jgi:colanic acid/amylovoran biosynthesis glycosyltransferase
MRLAYLINQYPAVSHTFIRREILAIEKNGHTVSRYALRSGHNLVDSSDQHEKRKTRYILQCSLISLARACASTMLFYPLRAVVALITTARLGWRSDRGLFRHLIYFVEATVLVNWCRIDMVAHIHAHFGTNSTTIAMLASKISGIPYSFTVHGPEEFDKAPLIALPDKIYNSQFTVAVTSFGRSQLFRQVDRSQWNKIHVVRCGIERLTGDDCSASPRRLICVGRLSEQKGHFVLIEATRLLLGRGFSFELILAGDGELRSEIEEQIKKDNLQDNIRITGWIDGATVCQEILASRALIQPSFAEGLPVAIMEAMALSRPIISTYIAGIPELVRPGKDGWLVPAGDSEALAQAMYECLQTSGSELAAMGKAARSRVYEYHDIETEAAKLSNLFQSSIANRKCSLSPIKGKNRCDSD